MNYANIGNTNNILILSAQYYTYPSRGDIAHQLSDITKTIFSHYL